MPSFLRLAKQQGVRWIHLDQCFFGCEYRKPTAILTNAPWMSSKTCEMRVALEGRPDHHVPLMGLVTDYCGAVEKERFSTALAAEYPEDMCDALAADVIKFLDLRDSKYPSEFFDCERVAPKESPLIAALPCGSHSRVGCPGLADCEPMASSESSGVAAGSGNLTWVREG